MTNHDLSTTAFLSRFLYAAQFGWTGLCAVAMLEQTRLIAPGRLHECLALTGYVLCATWFAYNFVSPVRWMRWTGWLSGGVSGCFFLLLSPAVQAAAMGGGVLWAAYYGFRRPGHAGLRVLPMLKPVVVSFAWAWMTVLLPVPVVEWPNMVLMFAERMAFVFALALAYDLHDLAYDRRHGLDTLASRLDVQHSFWLINAVLLLSAGCVAGSFFLGKYTLPVLLSLLMSLLISGLWLRFLFQKQEWEAWRKAGVDALIVGQFGVVVISSWGH